MNNAKYLITCAAIAIACIVYVVNFNQYKWMSTSTRSDGKQIYYSLTLSEYDNMLNSFPKTDRGFYLKSQFVKNTQYKDMCIVSVCLPYIISKYLHWGLIFLAAGIGLFFIRLYIESIVKVKLKTNSTYMGGNIKY